MIRQVATWTIPDSIGSEIRRKAMAWGKKLTKYSRDKWPDQEVEVLTNLDGPGTAVHWVFKFESMAERETWWKAFFEDDGIKSLMDELEGTERATGTTPYFSQSRSHYYRMGIWYQSRSSTPRPRMG